MDNNIQAFPIVLDNNDFNVGMTLLDYLAGELAQGYLASMNAGILTDHDLRGVAERSYMGAQLMLEERKKYIK